MLADERRRAADVAGRLREVDERAELPHAPDDRVLVLGDEAEALVVGVEERRARPPSCRRGTSFGTPASSSTRDHTIAGGGPERAARAAPRARRRCSCARRRDREARVVGELGHAEHAAQAATQCSVLDRRDLDPPVAASRTGGSTRRCRAGRRRAADRGTASPSTSSASDASIAPPSSSDVHSSWPSPVRRWWYSAASAADDRQHRVGGVAHPEAVVQRLVAGVHRARLVLEPGGRLEQRVETAEVRRAGPRAPYAYVLQ